MMKFCQKWPLHSMTKPHLISSIKELLVLPKPNSKSQKKGGRNAFNSKTVCITDSKVLEELKAKEVEKADVEEKKRMKMVERAKKKKLKEREKERRREKKTSKAANRKNNQTQENVVKKLASLSLGDERDDAQCPLCGLLYMNDKPGDPWICCDKCNEWYCFKCSGIKYNDVNEEFYCKLCY